MLHYIRNDNVCANSLNRQFIKSSFYRSPFIMQVIYHGHSFIEIELENGSVLIDPYVSENPRCDVTVSDVIGKNITHIVLTHGHDDHLGDTVFIAQQT